MEPTTVVTAGRRRPLGATIGERATGCPRLYQASPQRRRRAKSPDDAGNRHAEAVLRELMDRGLNQA